MRKKKEPKPKNLKQKEIFQIKRDWITKNLKGNIQWPRSMKILGEMMEVVDNLEFWKEFKLWQPFEHLYWFLKDSGRAYLLEQYAKWKKNQILGKLVANNGENSHTYELGNKIGEDVKEITKPKSLKDFLKE